MNERPLLLLPTPGAPIARAKRHGGPPNSHFPSRNRQAERLSPLFTGLQNAFDARRTRLQTEALGLAPEEVIVLETIGDVDDFLVAIRKIPGMEWLGEIEEGDIPRMTTFLQLPLMGLRAKKSH